MPDSPDVQIQPEAPVTSEHHSEIIRDKALLVAKYYEAKALYEIGDLEGCLRCLEASFKLDPSNTDILYRYAWIALYADKPILAKNLYDKLIERAPSYKGRMQEFLCDLYDLRMGSDIMDDSRSEILNTISPRYDVLIKTSRGSFLAQPSIQEELALKALAQIGPPARKRFISLKTRRGAPDLHDLHRSYPLKKRA